VWVAAATGAKRVAAKPVLTIGAAGPELSFDPAKDNGFPGFMRPLAYENLIYAKQDGTFGPGLATSWRYLKAKPGSGRANKDFEFTLRRNARFSNGTPVTAQAVKAWFDYYAKTNGPFALFVGPIASAEAIGKWTVRIHLKSPNPLMPFAIGWGTAGSVASPSCVANPPSLLTQTCGAGPYMLDPSQTVANDHYTWVPNPYYYDKSKVKWSKIVVRVITVPSSGLQALQTGQLDVAFGHASTADAAAAAGLTVAMGPATDFQGYTLDVGGSKSKPLADVRVRQALNYALDRKTITASLLGRYGKPTSTVRVNDVEDPKYENFYPYNPARAKSLLAAAGYPNGFMIEQVNVDPLRVNEAQAVAKYLADVGVKLDLLTHPNRGAWANRVLTNPTAMMSMSGGGGLPMWAAFTSIVKPGALFNRIGGGWSDRALTTLWIKGQRAADPAPYWKAMVDRITTQAYYLPVWSQRAVWYVSRRVGGVVVNKNQTGQVSVVDWFPK
jgi:peptide/nickel transport system substrate-binding protein